MRASKEFIRDAWPNAFSILLPEGWAVYGGIEELESVPLALEQESEDDAWDEAAEYYRDMVARENERTA